VFVPYYEHLVTEINPQTILEVGGGTGHLAKALCEVPEIYMMIEPSLGMYKVATEVLDGKKVTLHNCAMESFCNEMLFELVISHMCIHSVSNIAEFCKAISRRLTVAGMFLMSLPHPAFYNDYKKFFLPEEFRYVNEQVKDVNFSVTLAPEQVIEGVPYCHRPLSAYVSHLVAAGLCLTRLDEIFPAPEIQELYGQPWKDPRYLVLGGSLMQKL